MPSLSVIIPTHKRAAILQQCLEHLEAQTVANDIEAVVVSDGHDPATCDLMKTASWSIPVDFHEIEKSQQGKARNLGVSHAKGEYCLFIGDDTLLAPQACAEHMRIHAMVESAVLGFATWDPALEITPVMRWLEESGWQFKYDQIEQYTGTFLPAHMQHRFTYTTHISLPTAFAEENAFREDVHLYGWEDIEWGGRLRDAGLQLYYNPKAKAHHHHHVTLSDSLRRMEILGKSAVIMSRRMHAFDRVPRGWKKWAYRASAALPTMAGKHRRAFLHGIKTEECKMENENSAKQ